MSDESIHEKLNRVRKPRVHIKYDVEDGGKEVQKELPFVIGVLGDFSGTKTHEKKLDHESRKFVQVDRDSFDDVMKRMGPQLTLRVNDTSRSDEGDGESDRTFPVTLNFKSMQDFSPASVAKQVPRLANLLKTRERLKSLLTKSDVSPELEDILERILENQDLDAVAKELEASGAGDSSADGSEKEND